MTAISEPSPDASRPAVEGFRRAQETSDNGQRDSRMDNAQERADVARRILDDQPYDAGVADRVLAYHLDRQHLAMTLWFDTSPNDDGTAYLRDVAHDIQRHLGAIERLIIQGGPGGLWAWCNRGRFSHPLRITDFAPPQRDVRVALGTPADGPGGFRRSHRQAVAAERVARRSDPAKFVWAISYADVAIPAMLTNNAEAARHFVQRELGQLAVDTADAADLRAALLTYLEEESNTFAASRHLQVSPGTLAYRVKRASELLNYDVATRRHRLQTALILAERFTTLVLDTAATERLGNGDNKYETSRQKLRS